MELKDIRGLGKASLEALNQEGIHTVDELLFTYPSSYDVYEIAPEKAFTGEPFCCQTYLDSKAAFLKFRPNVFSVIFYAVINGIRVKCIMFSSDYLRYKLFKGTSIILYGRYKSESKEILVSRVFFDDFEKRIDVNYRLKGVKSYQMQKFVAYVKSTGYKVEDTLPKALVDKYKLYDLSTLIYKSHFPKDKEDIHQINRRRKYEEFFWYAMSFELLKRIRSVSRKPERKIDEEKLSSFLKSLPFLLTEGQKKAIEDCIRDIKGPYPMNRLVQGDVGCGKSMVAIYSVLAVVMAGYQGAVMVPTELLANQQYELFKGLFEPYGIEVGLLTSSIKKKEKNEINRKLSEGEIRVLIGTHALIQDTVEFKNLGIAVIDEQHKFGVEQRKKLIGKYPDVDALYLTATPIPRTLGLTVFGDLDISSVHTMPEGRIPVTTKILTYNQMKGLCHSIYNHTEAGEQVYAVVPLVTENEAYDAISIQEAEGLFREYLPDLPMGIVHGKMAADKKNEIMKEFREGTLKMLISTTVIEVGVNVPSATIMVILDADRFGLAQIHQLRGRVGRGTKESFCALVTKNPENERLKTLEVISDGFGIADADFKQRGPGNYFGEEQSGFTALEYADFETDFRIWECAKRDAEEYYPEFSSGKLESPRFTQLKVKNEENGSKIN